MGRIKSMIVVGAAVGTAMLAAPGMAQAADYGDGLLACNSGEICFWQGANNTGGTKHFYNNASHDGYAFSNGATFKGEASSIRNKDTACQVRVTEEYDVFESVNTFYFPNGGSNYNFNGDLNDDNGSHTRC